MMHEKDFDSKLRRKKKERSKKIKKSKRKAGSMVAREK